MSTSKEYEQITRLNCVYPKGNASSYDNSVIRQDNALPMLVRDVDAAWYRLLRCNQSNFLNFYRFWFVSPMEIENDSLFHLELVCMWQNMDI